MDDFLKHFSYGFPAETMKDFLWKSMEVFLKELFGELRKDPLREILEKFWKPYTGGFSKNLMESMEQFRRKPNEGVIKEFLD